VEVVGSPERLAETLGVSPEASPPGCLASRHCRTRSISARSTSFHTGRTTSRRESQNSAFCGGEMDKQFVNPAALGAQPRFYSHAVSIAGPAKLVYVSGQVSWGADGKVVGAGDMRAQCDQVFKHLTSVLRAVGGGLD